MFFAQNGDPSESARLAGYAEPKKDGFVLLSREDVGNYINSLCEQNLKYLSKQIIAGYERLAFGSVADAVKLMFAGDTADVDNYDLFNVAEIKHPKENAMEIKFFDRLKALEKLEFLAKPDKNNTSDFYNAILVGLKNVKSDGDDIT